MPRPFSSHAREGRHRQPWPSQPKTGCARIRICCGLPRGEGGLPSWHPFPKVAVFSIDIDMVCGEPASRHRPLRRDDRVRDRPRRICRGATCPRRPRGSRGRPLAALLVARLMGGGVGDHVLLKRLLGCRSFRVGYGGHGDTPQSARHLPRGRPMTKATPPHGDVAPRLRLSALAFGLGFQLSDNHRAYPDGTCHVSRFSGIDNIPRRS